MSNSIKFLDKNVSWFYFLWLIYHKQFLDTKIIRNCPNPNMPPNQRWQPPSTKDWTSSSPTLYHSSSHRLAWTSPQNIYTRPLATATQCYPATQRYVLTNTAAPSPPSPTLQATSTINPLVYDQPQSHTTLPVTNRHPQPHTMHPIPIYSRQCKPLYMKVVVIQCREKCKTLNLKINDGHSSGTSYNKFLFNDSSFPFIQLQ